MTEKIRVMIADDHPLVRAGLTAILGAEEDMVLVGEAADGEECVDKARALRPDVVVVDLNMPKKDGLSAIREIVEEQPDVRLLVLTGLVDDDLVQGAVQAGALGFILKDGDIHQLIDAIRAVYHGTTVLPHGTLRRILGEHRHPRVAEKLTPREQEVLRLIAVGLQNKEIARRLNIAEPTALSHVRNIFRKLQLGNRTEAALYATKNLLD